VTVHRRKSSDIERMDSIEKIFVNYKK